MSPILSHLPPPYNITTGNKYTQMEDSYFTRKRFLEQKSAIFFPLRKKKKGASPVVYISFLYSYTHSSGGG